LEVTIPFSTFTSLPSIPTRKTLVPNATSSLAAGSSALSTRVMPPLEASAVATASTIRLSESSSAQRACRSGRPRWAAWAREARALSRPWREMPSFISFGRLRG
jgi:hypothetical protein